jgi:hypothetical protein
MPRSWHRRATICLARRLSRLGSGCRRLPVRAWRSTGRMATRVAGHSAGCVMLALVLLATKNAELAGVSRESLNHSLRRCCRCIRLRPGLSLFLLLAGMRSVFIGMTGTRAGSIRGITFAAIAFVRCAAPLRKSDRWGFAPSFSAHVRWCERRARVQSCFTRRFCSPGNIGTELFYPEILLTREYPYRVGVGPIVDYQDTSESVAGQKPGTKLLTGPALVALPGLPVEFARASVLI